MLLEYVWKREESKINGVNTIFLKVILICIDFWKESSTLPYFGKI